MTKRRDFQGIALFILISFVYSWSIMFVVDAWLVPVFSDQGNTAALWLTSVFGHMLAMAGPALAAILVWRLYHKESPPPWRWSRIRFYLLIVAAMLVLWTLPTLIGMMFGNTIKFRNPIETYVWTIIAGSLAIGWLAGLGEEVGWTAYLLPRLSPHIGKFWALVVSGIIRGLWHWPVLIGPMIAQVFAGEKTVGQLLAMSLLFIIQLAISNVFFGAVLCWIWYRTESMPLVGWFHQWFDTTREVTRLLVIGYASSLWSQYLWALPFNLIGFLALVSVAREERSRWTNFLTFSPKNK